jgi:hypothetical protein
MTYSSLRLPSQNASRSSGRIGRNQYHSGATFTVVAAELPLMLVVWLA